MADGLEKAGNQGRFRIICLTNGPYPKALIIAKSATDDGHLLQMQRQKIIAVGFAALSQRRFNQVSVRQLRPLGIQTPQTGGIRDGFQIKDQGGNHRAGR